MLGDRCSEIKLKNTASIVKHGSGSDMIRVFSATTGPDAQKEDGVRERKTTSEFFNLTSNQQINVRNMDITKCRVIPEKHAAFGAGAARLY